MKKCFSLLILACFAVIALSLGSCKQNSTNPAEESIQSSEDNALIESEYTSIYSMVDQQTTSMAAGMFERVDKGNGIQVVTVQKSELLPPCANLSWDSVAKVLTIDFGPTNCLCKDDIWRRGKIIVTYKGKYPDVNSGWTTTLQDYYVQDMKVTGTKTVAFLGLFKVQIVVTNASIATPTGTVSWASDRTIEKIAGLLTPKNPWDDEYRVTGSASGVNRQGVAFTVTIDKPLIKDVSCLKKEFVSGVLTISNDKGKSMTLDYDGTGTQSCTKLAKVTIDGQTKTIVLR